MTFNSLALEFSKKIKNIWLVYSRTNDFCSFLSFLKLMTEKYKKEQKYFNDKKKDKKVQIKSNINDRKEQFKSKKFKKRQNIFLKVFLVT